MPIHTPKRILRSDIKMGFCLLALQVLAACSTIRDIPSENFNERKDTISTLVIHHTSANFEDSVNILTKPSSNSVSSHYLVPDPSDESYTEDKVRVYRLVPDEKRAWHAGRSYWAGKSSLNDSSIGIEVVNQTYCVKPDAPASADTSKALSVTSPQRFCFYPDFPESQFVVLTELVESILERNPQIPPTHIIGHSDIAPERKIDPGPRFPWHRLYKLGYGAWFDDDVAVKYWNKFIYEPVPLLNVQRALSAYGYNIQATGVLDTQTRNVLQAFQLHFRPSEITGEPSVETTAILYALIEKYRPDQLEELLAYPAQGPLGKPTMADAPRIHDRTLVLDSHIDLELDLIADDRDPWSSGESRATLSKMKTGGMDGAFLIVFSPQGEANAAGIETASEIAERRYQAIARLTEKYPNEIALARTADEARRIHRSGKRIALIGIENAYPLGNSTEDITKWAARGVRYVGITHVGHNQFADSSNPSYARGETESLHGGLSPLGEELIAKLNTAGIIVDISHASKATSLQAMKLSQTPVLASHSGVSGVSKNLRNLDDEQLLALKDNGGVIHIVAYGPYLKDKTPEQKAFETRIRKEMGLEDDFAFMAMDADTEAAFDAKMAPAKALSTPANIRDLIDHVDYVVRKIGIDHVGISSDFDGGGRIQGWMDTSETLNVTKELIARGYSETDIQKIWGGNLLRVLEAAQAHASQ